MPPYLFSASVASSSATAPPLPAAREAAAAVDQAGDDGWRRLFERTLFAEKRLEGPAPSVEIGSLRDKKGEAAASIEPAFALARLSPSAGAALARFLADVISSPGGGSRLFERPGPNPKLTAIAAGATALPWDEAGRRAWNDGLARWLIDARGSGSHKATFIDRPQPDQKKP